MEIFSRANKFDLSNNFLNRSECFQVRSWRCVIVIILQRGALSRLFLNGAGIHNSTLVTFHAPGTSVLEVMTELPTCATKADIFGVP